MEIRATFLAESVPESQKQRYSQLASRFKECFGHPCEFYVRAPGRVNLIGEHIDYCGYAVLPMALEQDIVAAGSANSTDKLVLHNMDNTYNPYTAATMRNITIEKNEPEWYKYFLCGVKGVLEHGALTQDVVGMNCLIDGNIPKSAGLSSSSALVCCAALVTMHANRQHISKTELAEICARCERYIGTEGGGMDQAISLLAKSGKASLIEFDSLPLKLHDVTLPDGAVFVVSNCNKLMNKAATAHFNTRVVEVRLGTQVLAKLHNLEWKNFRKPKELQNALSLDFDGMLAVTQKMLKKEAYSKAELCTLLGVTEDELAVTSLSPNTLHVTSFRLQARSMHVYGEAQRVYKFRGYCQGDQTSETLVRLGTLMNDSHGSCSVLYECSCDELDQLVTVCRTSGALGSRMTGAGWGGCAVSLVARENLTSFMDSVAQLYYSNFPNVKLSDVMFATQPGSGAAIYTD